MSGAERVGRDGVAVVDDEPLVLRALQRILSPGGHDVVTASSLDGLGHRIDDPRLAVVLLDLFIGGPGGERAGGIEALDRLRDERPDVEVVVMTGRASIESAVACMRAGAFDYLCKPFSDVERVREAVRAARRQAVGERDDDGSWRRTGGSPSGIASDWLRVPLVAPQLASGDVPLSLEAYERLALERALRESAGDAAEAARRLGIGRSTFYRRASKVGVDLRTAEGDPAVHRPAVASPTARRVGEGPSIG